MFFKETLHPTSTPKQSVKWGEGRHGLTDLSCLTVSAHNRTTEKHVVRLWHEKAKRCYRMWEKHPIDSKKSPGRKLGVGWQRVAVGVWWWRVGVRKECSLHSFSPCYQAYTHIITSLSHKQLWKECSISFSLCTQRQRNWTFTCLMIVCHQFKRTKEPRSIKRVLWHEPFPSTMYARVSDLRYLSITVTTLIHSIVLTESHPTWSYMHWYKIGKKTIKSSIINWLRLIWRLHLTWHACPWGMCSLKRQKCVKDPLHLHTLEQIPFGLKVSGL